MTAFGNKRGASVMNGAAMVSAVLSCVCLPAAGERDQGAARTPDRKRAVERLLAGRFDRQISQPSLRPAKRRANPCYGVKDPSIVHYDGRWHLFYTIRSRKPPLQIEYLSFSDWDNANAAPRHVLELHDGMYCAPQVFLFAPQGKWYLIYHVVDPSRNGAIQPVYSTTTDIADPTSWSKATPLIVAKPLDAKLWIDFWVICDATRAHLFFTSHDGRMWRTETTLADFPNGWGQATVALHNRFWEASHTYRLEGLDKFLTIVEVRVHDGRRYFEAYVADALDGQWRPLANSEKQPFAGPTNTRAAGKHWADSVSHGELIRAGHDQNLEVDPARLRFLFQGVSDQARRGKPYPEIAWALGILEPLP